MSEVKIAAEKRTEFGKGASRQVRRDHKVPAVLYGHGKTEHHLILPAHELMLALKTPNVLLGLDIDGKTQLAIPKEVQRHPIKGYLEHVDLLMVKRGEKVAVEVPITVEGKVVAGGTVMQDLNELEVSAPATAIPESFVVDVTDVEIGSHILAKDISLPNNVDLVTDPEALIVSIAAEQTAEQAEAEMAAAEADMGVVRDEKDEDAAEKADEK